MHHRLMTTAVALLALGASAAAHEFTLGELTIDHPYALATPATAQTGAGYLSITNAGDTADRLVAVEADFPRAALHTTEIDAEGVTRMRPAEGIEIPPGATVTLAPRGTHVMFMGLAAPFEAGDSFAATLVFEQAGEIEVQFTIETRDDAGATEDHGGHSSGG